MDSVSRYSQFVVTLAPGLTLTRLPIGDAYRTWWVPFAVSGRGLLMGPDGNNRRYVGDLLRQVTFAGPDGTALRSLGRSLGGGDRTHSGLWEFEHHDEAFMHITYAPNGQTVATETVELRV